MRLPNGLVLCWFCFGALAFAQTWPQFRGPTGDGISTATHPVEWSNEHNIAWKESIKGFAWSQPVVAGGKVFVTTAVTDQPVRPQAGDLSPGFSFFSPTGLSRVLQGGRPADLQCTWKLICLDLETGKRLWEQPVHEGKPPIAVHRSNSYASETPVTDGERVYVHVSMVGLWCFDINGKELWHKPLPLQPMQFGWGAGASPCLHEDTLFLVCDNEKESFLLAIDKLDGTGQWRVDRSELSNWATPYIWRHQHGVELILCGGKQTISYDPGNGGVIWSLPAGGRSSTTAVGNRALLVVGSVARNDGQSRSLVAVRAGAKGELDQDSDHVAWSAPRAAPELASPLLHGDFLFSVKQQGGILACHDLASGKLHYRKRLPGAAGFTASPWTMNGQLFLLDENGKTFVVRPGKEPDLLHENQVDGIFRSSVAVAAGRLLLRSVDHLYCISAE